MSIHNHIMPMPPQQLSIIIYYFLEFLFLFGSTPFNLPFGFSYNKKHTN
jgi:hypothetical protein